MNFFVKPKFDKLPVQEQTKDHNQENDQMDLNFSSMKLKTAKDLVEWLKFVFLSHEVPKKWIFKTLEKQFSRRNLN